MSDIRTAEFGGSFYAYGNRATKKLQIHEAFESGLGTGPPKSATSLLKKIVRVLAKAFEGYKFKTEIQGIVGGDIGSVWWEGKVLTEKGGQMFQVTIKSQIRKAKYSNSNYTLSDPVYTLGLWPARWSAYPSKELSKKTSFTMRDVGKLLKEFGPDKMLNALGGPLKGKSSVTSISDVRAFIQKQRTWFELEGTTPDSLSYSTRENGDVGYEEVGPADIEEAYLLKKALLAEYGAQALEIGIEIVDEWVHLGVALKGRKASLRQAVIRLAHANPGLRHHLLPLVEASS